MISEPVYLFSLSSHPLATSVNSLDITLFKPSIDFSQYDYFILTSKQAVQALKQYDKASYIHKGAVAISAATAKSYEAIGGAVLEQGEGYGDNLEAIIKKYDKSLKWLYIRAKEIASDFAKNCREDGYNIEEVVAYESRCSQAIEEVSLPSQAVLIFTSPSSVKCFLQHHTILPTHRVIVIGKTTAKALPQGVKCELPMQKSIDSCLELLFIK